MQIEQVTEDTDRADDSLRHSRRRQSKQSTKNKEAKKTRTQRELQAATAIVTDVLLKSLAFLLKNNK